MATSTFGAAMKISPKNPLFIFFLLMSLVLLATGFGFLWHYIGPNPFFGIAPEGEMPTDDDWYALNNLTGWALIFIGVVSAMLSIQLRKLPSRGKYAASVFIGLAISVVLAAVFLEIVATSLNIK
jgi:hypothetical protein